MAATAETSDFRAELVAMYEEYTAIRLLGQNLTAEDYERVQESKLALKLNCRQSVRKASRDLQREIQSLQQAHGVNAARTTRIRLLRRVEGSRRPIAFIMLKAPLGALGFEHLEAVFAEPPRT